MIILLDYSTAQVDSSTSDASIISVEDTSTQQMEGQELQNV